MSLTASGLTRTVVCVDPRRQAATDARVEHQARLGIALREAALEHERRMAVLKTPYGRMRELTSYIHRISVLLGGLTRL